MKKQRGNISHFLYSLFFLYIFLSFLLFLLITLNRSIRGSGGMENAGDVIPLCMAQCWFKSNLPHHSVWLHVLKRYTVNGPSLASAANTARRKYYSGWLRLYRENGCDQCSGAGLKSSVISLGAKGTVIGEGRCPYRSGDADQPTVSRRRVADGCNQCFGDVVTVITDKIS